MKIIGEKINGTRKRVAQAIAERDAAFIVDLAQKQADAGAAWLDVNAGTMPAQEPDDLIWLIDTIQAVVDTPISLDSANPKALSVAVQAVRKTPLINSISGERNRLEGVLPLVAGNAAGVIALLLDDNGIPKDVDGRMTVARRLLALTPGPGIARACYGVAAASGRTAVQSGPTTPAQPHSVRSGSRRRSFSLIVVPPTEW
mgnify:CR=1 FL=1